MATHTVPTEVAQAWTVIEQVYAVSNVQTQQDIKHMVSSGLGVGSFSLSPSRESNRALYERDFYTWTQTTAALIRAGTGSDIDRETLAEEVESLGISQRHALGSHLKNLVMHLLKWHYQPSRRQTGHSWRSSIINARDEIDVILDDSPSLRREVLALLARRYPTARMLAHDETGLPLPTFPEACPWTPEQVLDANFWPEADSGV